MKFKIMTAIIGIIFYTIVLIFLLMLLSTEPHKGVALIIYIIVCIAITAYMISESKNKLHSRDIEFCKTGAFDNFGFELAIFSHEFTHDKNITDELVSNISTQFKNKLNAEKLHEIKFTDTDTSLKYPETRTFYKSSGHTTTRNISITFICMFTATSQVQGVLWWILSSGIRDINKVAYTYIFSPLIIPLVFIKYAKNKYTPTTGLMSIPSGFFNEIDIATKAREIQLVAYETLINTLESHNIDTSDLKAQKSSTLNINVSGKNTTIGSIAQGAHNKIAASIQKTINTGG